MIRNECQQGFAAVVHSATEASAFCRFVAVYFLALTMSGFLGSAL